MTTLKFDDLQGIIRRGYGNLETACFLLLEITDVRLAKGWLRELADVIRDATATPEKTDTCVNIAFTQAGFKELGLENQFFEDKRFSIEFEDGMTTEHRQVILGDHGDSAPENWVWGGPTKPAVHVLLLLYARDQGALKALSTSHRTKFEAGGLAEIRRLDTHLLPDRKEHFGFRDGISQPKIAGLQDKAEDETERAMLQTILDQGGSDGNIVAAGEFILGYLNAYSKIPTSPKVKIAGDTGGYLKDDGKGALDFGRNGSYLVFRSGELRYPEAEVREFCGGTLYVDSELLRF